MILSKSILHSRGTICVVLSKYQIVSKSSFHYLRPLVRPKLTAANSTLVPEFGAIISRFESSQASIGKDVILQIPNEPSPSNTASSVVTDNIPDIPVVSEIISESAVPLNKLGEATLDSIGLGSYFTPVGWLQRILEYLHVTFDMPWWSSIAICVVVARLVMFPLVIKHQKNSAVFHNVMPEMTALQMKMQNAKMYGNHVETMQVGHELAVFMQKNKVSPLSTMTLPIVQAPIFISFFWALKNMAAAPVESFKEGGMYWFMDLTVPDQFCALPAITSVTLWLTLELGADFTKVPSASLTSRYMPYIFRVIPVVVFAVTMNFPSAICIYWTMTNFVSLVQVAFLKVPAVRRYFEIPEKDEGVKTNMKKSGKGVVNDIKSTFGNMKIAKEIAERERLDESNFKRAGRQPPAKTFKYNPLQASQAVQAKKQ